MGWERATRGVGMNALVVVVARQSTARSKREDSILFLEG